MTSVSDQLGQQGFAGPIPLLSAEECRGLLRILQNRPPPAPGAWAKDGAAKDWRLARLAAHPRLLELLTDALGENIICWGCQLIQRVPGEVHPWHVDIESAAPDGRFVSVWIGLENTSAESSLRFIPGSHRFTRTIQQYRAEGGQSRAEVTTELVLGWAQSETGDAHLIEPAAKDGDAILFDGRLWHGSDNHRELGRRSAVILQFAAADCPVRIPDPDNLNWPFKLLDEPRPPVLVVKGTAPEGRNHVVPVPQPPPAPAPLRSSVRELGRLGEHPEGGWKPYALIRGSTPALTFMSCHAAVLSGGHSPHLPHAHGDEELLVVLDGEADLLVADKPDYQAARPVRVTAGDFIYYPPFQHHTIRNAGAEAVRYMMFRWNRRGSEAGPPTKSLGTTLFQRPVAAAAQPGRGFVTRTVLDAPTRWLRKLHCHVSRLEPNAGYPAHADAYDVAILVQSGRLRTLGREAGPGSLIYYPAGEVHGMRNVGDAAAHYLVFEFHGARVSSARELAAAPQRQPPEAVS